MARAKQPSKRKRRGKALAALGATGLSFSLASSASAAPAVNMPRPNTGASHEITLAEEELSEDEKSKENPDSLRLHGSFGFVSAIGAFVGPNLGPFPGVENAFYEKGIASAFLAADCQPE